MEKHRVKYYSAGGDFLKEIMNKYKRDKDVLGIILFGSLARGKFDEYSDIDVYLLTKRKKKYSRTNFLSGKFRIDILIDSVKEAKKYLCEDRYNVRRVTSHMLACGKIIYRRTKDIEKIQRIAKKNIKLKTKYNKDEILMHKYSIDDFWGEVQRDCKKRDYTAFGLDSQLLMNNIIELFLKLHRTFWRRSDETAETLIKLDKSFALKVSRFYKAKSILSKKKILGELVKYTYRKAGGEMPRRWKIH